MLKITLFSLVLFVLFRVPSSEGARILVVFGQPVPSMFYSTNILVEELVNRGHDVTFISCFGSKIKAKNIRDIVLTESVKIMADYKETLSEISKQSVIGLVNNLLASAEHNVEEILSNKEVQDLVKNEKFDVVITTNYFGEGLFVFVHHFDCPVIYFCPVEANYWVNQLVANPEPASYLPQFFSNWPTNMDFWQRTQNFLLSTWNDIIYTGFHMNRLDEMIHKYFPSAPSLRQIINERVALILLNSSPVIVPAKPLLPNMIEIGGFHLKELKPLPKELQNYLDNSTEGFILFSMGSNMRTTMFSQEKMEIFMKVFAKLPYPILGKFENDYIPGKPDNLRIEKWLPQNDILAHPNLKLFITQGGLLSTTEAVYHGVPIVGIPVLGDQHMNMFNAERLGIGRKIEFQKLSCDELFAIIQEVLHDKTYRETVKNKSALLKDTPLKPLDTAMYWIDYVLRHKYSNHFKTSGIYLTWYQIKSLDVVVFLGFIVFFVVYILQLILKQCYRILKHKYYCKSCGNEKKEQ